MESDEILIAYPVRKRNQQLGDDKVPVVWLSIPFRRYILHCKEQDLEQRVIGGEAKAKYDYAVSELKSLLEEGKELQMKELMREMEKSGKSFEEMIRIIRL